MKERLARVTFGVETFNKPPISFLVEKKAVLLFVEQYKKIKELEAKLEPYQGYEDMIRDLIFLYNNKIELYTKKERREAVKKFVQEYRLEEQNEES